MKKDYKLIITFFAVLTLVVVLSFIAYVNNSTLKTKELNINDIISIEYTFIGAVDDTYYDPFSYFYGYSDNKDDKEVIAYEIKIENISTEYVIYDIMQSCEFDDSLFIEMSYDTVLFDGESQILSPGEVADAINYCIIEKGKDNDAIYTELQLCDNSISFKINNTKYSAIGTWRNESSD